jgi:hypothetical protein
LLGRARHVAAALTFVWSQCRHGRILAEGTGQVEATITFAAQTRAVLARRVGCRRELWVGDIGTLPHQMDETATDAEILDAHTTQNSCLIAHSMLIRATRAAF